MAKTSQPRSSGTKSGAAGRGETYSGGFTLELLGVALEACEVTQLRPLQLSTGSFYTLTIHPQSYRWLVMLRAKAKWKERYRAERLARRGLATASTNKT